LSGRRLPLRARLMLLVLACTVPLIAMGLAREYTIYRDARARIGDGLLSQARLLSLAVERDIHLRVSAMEVLAASTPLTEGTFDGFRPQAQAFLALQPPGAAIGVADADGRLVAVKPRRPFGWRQPPSVPSLKMGRPTYPTWKRARMRANGRFASMFRSGATASSSTT
jgi:hypothetical protein